MYENPAEITRKILHQICINFGINSPYAGDAYDETKPNLIKEKPKFAQTIQSLCQQKDVFY